MRRKKYRKKEERKEGKKNKRKERQWPRGKCVVATGKVWVHKSPRDQISDNIIVNKWLKEINYSRSEWSTYSGSKIERGSNQGLEHRRSTMMMYKLHGP
jgi:hypothetical protein